MQAAKRFFPRFGFHETAPDKAAPQAGGGRGTIYRRFADKEAPFFQTAVRGFDLTWRSATTFRSNPRVVHGSIH